MSIETLRRLRATIDVVGGDEDEDEDEDEHGLMALFRQGLICYSVFASDSDFAAQRCVESYALQSVRMSAQTAALLGMAGDTDTQMVMALSWRCEHEPQRHTRTRQKRR